MKRLSCFVAIIGVIVGAVIAFAEQHSVDVSGKWDGQWTSTYGTGSAELKLVQTGSRVTGTIELGGTRTFGYGAKNVEGQVQGNTFSLSAAGDQCTVNASVTFESGKKHDTLRGNFSCAQSGNSFDLYRNK